MAKEQWKKIGAISGLVTLGLSILVMAVLGGGKAMAIEKDIEANAKLVTSSIERAAENAGNAVKVVSDNQVEDRNSIIEIASLVKSLQEKQNIDYRELKQENNDNKVRDEKTASEYGLILSHMTQQTAAVSQLSTSLTEVQVNTGKLQAQYETLTKD